MVPTLLGPLCVGALCWLTMALGFLGLRMLMQERPQFVGQPLRSSKVELVQEAPQVMMRGVADDVSLVKPGAVESSEVEFDMRGRRDYRGLRTLMDMSGAVRARYVVTNAQSGPVFVWFRCAHPRSAGDADTHVLASALRLEASAEGWQENGGSAWVWTGAVPAGGSVRLDVSYQVASLKGVSYRVSEPAGSTVKQLRVVFRRQDLGAMRFEGGEGAIPAAADSVVWERRDFLAPDFFSATLLESRNLFASLSQLLEMGPLVSLLFLVAMAAVVLARQRLTVLQVMTLSAGYALYFPLVLYLSARFSFAVALGIAVVVPGALLVNYARWLLGPGLGLVGGPIFLGLYQVFPTLAAFAGWNRGLVLLCLGVVTLWVLVNLQNRALRRAARAAACLVVCATLTATRAAEVQVILPAELARAPWAGPVEADPPLLELEPARYRVRPHTNYFRVEAEVRFRVLRPGHVPAPLFRTPAHFESAVLESAETGAASLITLTNCLGLFAQRPGAAILRVAYRVAPVEREGRHRLDIPLIQGPSGALAFESSRSDCQFLTGCVWHLSTEGSRTLYDVGVSGEDRLVVEWRGGEVEGAGGAASGAGGSDVYGIGLTRAQHLTVITSDGSCTHFSEFEVPVHPAEEFALRLPPEARLISVLVNGAEIAAPAMDEQRCTLRLPPRDAQQTAHRLSLRIAYPAVRLGFAGLTELTLPEVFQTAGRLEWVVALPAGFETTVLSSGLERQSAAPDLNRFGDYGRILQSHPHTFLSKDLAPPGLVRLSLRYRQVIHGLAAGPGPR